MKNHILDIPDILQTLLIDRTKSHKGNRHSIFWGTSDYERLGKGYQYNDEIKPCAINGDNFVVVIPRVQKMKSAQSSRSKEMAEVFTPSWLCNRMNNASDEQWFGRKNIFNIEDISNNSWSASKEKIIFPEGKTWQEYVKTLKLEIACGEAPFLVSIYDATTGEPIEISERIGILDRKLRIVSENTVDEVDWIDWSKEAYRSVYGYEWQGDSLFLARKALLQTFIDYYTDKFKVAPEPSLLLDIAEIISWNLWQMDGLKGIVPGTCHEEVRVEGGLFGDDDEIRTPCPGCEKDDIRRHNGTYCKIMDWSKGKAVLYIDTMR